MSGAHSLFLKSGISALTHSGPVLNTDGSRVHIFMSLEERTVMPLPVPNA